MVARHRVPDRGDIIWLDFKPTKGREQSGHRPALVLSPHSYNKASELALVCPITSKRKGYPFEVSIPSTAKFDGGVALVDQLRSVSWKERHAKRIEGVSARVAAEVAAKVITLIS